jgi:hypothetical protein
MAKKRANRKQRDEDLEAALISLDRSRGPLFREMELIAAGERGPRSESPHKACTREFNRMRITDLEAIDIARAFHEKPHLAGKLPEVFDRLGDALAGLKDTEDPQAFTCPLLDGKKCMVHHVAKPIACLAWNPGRDYSKEGWHSLQRREKLNSALFGDRWRLQAIPLQLARFLGEEDRLAAGPSGSTLRKRAMASGGIPRREEKEAAAAASAAAREVERDPRRATKRGRRGAARFAKPVGGAVEDRARAGSGRGPRGARGSRGGGKGAPDDLDRFDPAGSKATRRRERLRGRESPRGAVPPARARKKPPSGEHSGEIPWRADGAAPPRSGKRAPGAGPPVGRDRARGGRAPRTEEERRGGKRSEGMPPSGDRDRRAKPARDAGTRRDDGGAPRSARAPRPPRGSRRRPPRS